jgi:hypothetical protein
MAEKTHIHLDTRDGLFALKEIVDAQPNVRNEKEWADAFFDMACVLRMIKMPPPTPEGCDCYSIAGDDPNCPVHT